ncbi:hypothetical protein FPCIR_8775 [Fusarium pseudocircinatum]|uniref:Uncharacterized protein n=1 Tax=Fusarium pseudocircinatum TaxID=56676 RepID=A0A8H5L0J9_9HYPO|nr:hypothetical protein FPCIR_8775 [Fusarium pseudocircinatum]
MTSPTLNLGPDERDSAEDQPSLGNTTKDNASPSDRQQRTTQPPFWLSKYALLLFALIFTALAASLIALKCASDSKDGFPLNFSSSEYSWTYGPTAVLVIILSFWRRVDYYYKATQPWRELESGPVPGSRSLLLDYVSPFQLQSVYQALRLRHYCVFATILSFFLLKGIILLSTTLFVVQYSSHSVPVDISYENTFDAASAWASFSFRSAYREGNLFVGDTEDGFFEGGSDRPIYKYVSRLRGDVARDYAWNTKDGIVTSSFKSRASAMNLTSLKAPVDLFLPIVTCEDAALTMDPPDVQGSYYVWNSSTCSTGRESSFICPDLRLHHDNTSMCGSQSWAYTLHRINCSEVRPPDEIMPYSSNLTNGLETFDLRYAITVAHHKISSMVKPTNVEDTIRLSNYSAVICKIGYKMVSVTATQDMLSRNVTLTPAADHGQGKLLRNLTNSSLAEMLMTDLNAASSSFVWNKDVPVMAIESTKAFGDWGASETLFQLMAVKLGDKFRPDILSQPSILKDLSVKILKGLLNEVARQSLLVDKGTNDTADGLVSSPRLRMSNVAAWIMVSGFSVLSIVCLLLMFAPSAHFWISAMGGSMAGHAAVLTNNPSLQRILEGSGELSEKSLTEDLGDLKFAMNNANGDVVINATEKDSLSDERERRTNKAKPWTPIAGSLYFAIATIAIPVLAIGALELLHQLSKQRQGLFDMNTTDSSTISITRMASTAIFFLISTMVNSLDFIIATFAPYGVLRAGSAPAETSVLFHLLSVSPFLIVFKSLRARQLGPASSNISSLLSSLLTIVSSGLWTLTPPANVDRSTSAMVGNWRTSWPAISDDDSGAAKTLNLIRHGGANTSAAIWQDVVLPSIGIAPDASMPDTVTQSSGYTYTVGALWPFINCTMIPRENLEMNSWVKTFYFAMDGAPSGYSHEKTISANVTTPAGCRGQEINGKSYMSFNTSVKAIDGEKAPADSRWVGRYLDLNLTVASPRAACPSIGIFFGTMGGNDTSKWNMTALTCTQGIEQVPINITFKGDPALGVVDEKHPPELARNQAWKWVNSTSKSSALNFKLKRFLDDDLKRYPTHNITQRPLDCDPFFNHLIYGPNAVKREELIGPRNVSNLIDAVRKGYGEYMRYVIDLNFRADEKTSHNELASALSSPSSDEEPVSPHAEINGIRHGIITRVATNPTSKSILQVLLAVIAVLSLAGYLLVKIRGTLPRDPCSIASTIAFLAGSQLCDRDSGIIPRGAEYMTDRQLKKAFDGWVFSLGWWQKGEASVESEERSDDVRTSGDTDRPDETPEGQGILGRFGIDVGRANVSKF